MPKTRNAFAFRDFDGKRILQRPFFRQWRERYQIRTDADDSDIIHSDSVMIDFIGGGNEKEKLQKAERYNQQLRELCNALVKLHKMITRHANKRLEPYRRAVQAKINADDSPFLQGKIAREQELVLAYLLDIATSIADLQAVAQKRWQDSETNLQAEYRRRFGERLRQARERAGLSRKELGDAINISPAGYAYYERGQRDVTPTSLIRIARLLKVSADWLIGLKESQ